MPYKLSATLTGHTADVRAVASPTDELVLSASRDTTAIAWNRSADKSSFTQTAVLHGGSRYLNAVTYLPPTPDAPSGYAVTGGQDMVINVFSLAGTKGEPNFSLIGHTDNVCALDAATDGTIISGSWDRTAKVWKDFQLAYDLIGHQQSVWAVLAIDGRQFLTGSADNTIKLWNQHKNVRTYPGHTQAVRGLALITDIGFASCSNDSEIRIWTMEGDVVHTLSGHTSFIYSISVLPNGDIVSGGEDRTVRIWRDGECVQTIVHPAISVWSVSTMPNGDIVTGCSDGVVRIFTAEESRYLPAELLKAYDEQVANQALPAQQVGDVKKSDLPGLEALSQPGKKPGEVKMIKHGDNVEAHQWDSATSSWQKIGDVVDAVGAGRKQLYEGKEYDYVFDVDVQEGMPPLKLPYNANENPYNAAQRFLQNHDLPLSYLDEVVRFIEKNTAGVSVGSGNNQLVDPFTGASRYQPMQSSVARGTTEFMDPFTGASRYRAQPTSIPSSPPRSQGDFRTGSSQFSGSSSPPTSSLNPPPGKAKVVPVRDPLSFRQANVSAMQTKLQQLDQALRNEISTSSLSMYPQESSLVSEAFTYLSQVISHLAHWTNPPATSNPLKAEHLDAIIALLDRWPREALFPIMDLARLLIAFCPDYSRDIALKQRYYAAMFNASTWKEPWETPLPRTRETNMLFLLRSLANTFQETVENDVAWTEQVLQELSAVSYNAMSKAQRIAFNTIFLNISCIGLREQLDPEIRAILFKSILQAIQNERTDSEAAYRALVALGNILCEAKQKGRSPDASQAKAIKQYLAALPAAFPEDRIEDVSKEVIELL
ncbi:PFU-domain-containing protein [Laetiporus sulphureus 93-53]|uniref:PFU-domain-containing protein n=1 Tax=Laetiporus sulphureus 93-53 TaxID=1314785 RepID=A0A165FZC0_9APHY|nr:PFU-domain-containing protein [Laetiporus sulphureus 93-53]KZT09614.1 PFU-domain-containing protein [Laetiporus sulphureus 93-53]